MLAVLLGSGVAGAQPRLPDTKPLIETGDLAAEMVAGIGKYLDRELAAAPSRRDEMWKREATSKEKFQELVKRLRGRLAKITGVVDERVPPKLEYVAGPGRPSLIAEGDGFEVHAVRWAVLPGVEAEGLLFEPAGAVRENFVIIPDADWTPEMLAGLAGDARVTLPYFAKGPARGSRILVPTLLNRKDTFSGNAELNRWTNQTHREFVYRMAYQMGRHVIGYEVQKVLAGIDWMEANSPKAPRGKVAVFGFGEGGLIARICAALDERIHDGGILGHSGPAEDDWKEPIYRNIWAFSRDVGIGELVRLTLPRGACFPLHFDPEWKSAYPVSDGPPPPRRGRSGAAPGRLSTPVVDGLEEEYERGEAFAKKYVTWRPFSSEAAGVIPKSPTEAPVYGQVHRTSFDAEARQKRQFDQLVNHTQQLWRDSERVRDTFWAKADASSVEAWEQSTEWYRDYFWEEVIGKLPEPDRPMNPRSRLKYDTPKWTGYEVTLDLYDDVFAYGILLLPKGMKPGEKRPVVVCQHGLEGRPTDVCDPTQKTRFYNSFGAQLADLGFIVYAPQNPYFGRDDFRVLQRKANPLGLSLFSFIVRQHERHLEWLKTLPNVDPDRIGFYGLSYGGKTAMRVPAILKDYCLSICSGDFNEWIGKNVSVDLPTSYMFTGEYEMPEFDLGNTFNYAEMAYLIAPRPFMVERGHDDGVGTDEMVAYEYAKVRRKYVKLGIPERTEIEFFDGGHEINLKGTLAFLRKHLDWPEHE